MNRELAAAAARLAAQAGYEGRVTLHPLSGGGNNRAFRVELAGEPDLFLKAYFHHPQDPRDRLGAEFAFSQYAWEAGVRCIPRPIAADGDLRLGLYEYVAGDRPAQEDVTPARVQEAAHFFANLNTGRDTAPGLAAASEASWTLAAHEECIRRRVDRLRDAADSDGDPAFRGFMRAELLPFARDVFRALCRLPRTLLEYRLPDAEWCISPSDFGFHNALIGPDGQLTFIDFEYAGWDEPARMICDFFCQVQVPVEYLHLGAFCHTVLGPFRQPALHLDRMRALMPLYQLKWCCIVLNEFLPVGAARRQFASREHGPEVQRPLKLAQARAMLDQLKDLTAA
jgi:Ser/Thr protein kinase RdoA (MazF antagonist)